MLKVPPSLRLTTAAVSGSMSGTSCSGVSSSTVWVKFDSRVPPATVAVPVPDRAMQLSAALKMPLSMRREPLLMLKMGPSLSFNSTASFDVMTLWAMWNVMEVAGWSMVMLSPLSSTVTIISMSATLPAHALKALLRVSSYLLTTPARNSVSLPSMVTTAMRSFKSPASAAEGSSMNAAARTMRRQSMRRFIGDPP